MTRNFFIIFALILTITPVALSAKKVSTKVKAPATKNGVIESRLKTYPYQISEFEEVTNKLTFMAYDKRAGADRETFFLDNGSKVDLKAIEIEITYFNSAGKQIHKRNVEIEQSFPSNETRRIDIKTWDSQKSYHYINSVPSAKGSSPYTVKFRILSFTPE